MKIESKNITYGKHVGNKLQITINMRSDLILVEYKSCDNTVDYENSLPQISHYFGNITWN